VERLTERLQTALRHFPEREQLLAPQRQRLDDLSDRLPRALGTRLGHARGELGRAGGALRPGLLAAVHRRSRERLDALWRVAQLAHPNKPLERGYARIEDRDGRTLISAEAARSARRLKLIFRDGDVAAEVAGTPAEKARRPAYGKVTVEQPKLL
jgi:exodeoxyribonuclease VII large subunit